jgi:hypothetical protein
VIAQIQLAVCGTLFSQRPLVHGEIAPSGERTKCPSIRGADESILLPLLFTQHPPPCNLNSALTEHLLHYPLLSRLT